MVRNSLAIIIIIYNSEGKLIIREYVTRTAFLLIFLFQFNNRSLRIQGAWLPRSVCSITGPAATRVAAHHDHG